MSSATFCHNCGEEHTSGTSLPVDDKGDVVGNAYKGEWGAVPCCRACYNVHQAACMGATPANERAIAAESMRARGVLKAYAEATYELRRKVFEARSTLRLIGGTVRETLDDVGRYPADGPDV